ncbi:MAG: epoxyqueuosine reductase QueH [Phascolarctobacterium sp.]|nr:epoxyqueuosine reductase QueH [Phascolarctobacterium sp.]
MKLLLHACCGPCACYPTEKLRADGKDFDILYYNPNIHPYKEFKQRLATLREFCTKKEVSLYVNKNYDLEKCVCGMMAEETIRCAYCYRMRLRYAAQFAKENGYDAFSTTLLVSIYQKHELIRKIAEEAAEEFGIPFYYEDFRMGYQRGVDISLEMGLYRQQYCGCVFSERDRYLIMKKKQKGPQEKIVRISKFLYEVKE